jgi:hypothetical protein
MQAQPGCGGICVRWLSSLPSLPLPSFGVSLVPSLSREMSGWNYYICVSENASFWQDVTLGHHLAAIVGSPELTSTKKFHQVFGIPKQEVRPGQRRYLMGKWIVPPPSLNVMDKIKFKKSSEKKTN